MDSGAAVLASDVSVANDDRIGIPVDGLSFPVVPGQYVFQVAAQIDGQPGVGAKLSLQGANALAGSSRLVGIGGENAGQLSAGQTVIPDEVWLNALRNNNTVLLAGSFIATARGTAVLWLKQCAANPAQTTVKAGSFLTWGRVA